MDPIKKRKLDDNGLPTDVFILTPDDARKILEPLTQDHLLEILQNALLRHPDVLEAVRSIADRDISQRKLFVRGLGWETTTEKLRALFSSYGPLDEAVVILDKVTGKSKGYGFVTFKHVDGAIMALKEPSKKIDGRMTVAQLAAAGISGGGGPAAGGGTGGLSNPVDVSLRKIYVSNVPYDMPSERLLQHFAMYGEIEEGPLGFDKITGKFKGFALFVYKTAEAARASLVDPVKNIDGHMLNCKLANDGKRGKPPGAGATGAQGGVHGNGDGIGVGMTGHYSGPGGNYSAFAGNLGAGAGTGGGGPLPGIGNQAAGSNLGVSGGGGSGIGGPYAGGSHFGGPIGVAYGGLGPGGGLGAGVGGGTGGAAGGLGATGSGRGAAGRGSSFYGLPPSSSGMVSGEHAQGGYYNLPSGGYQGPHNQLAGALPALRIPPGGGYQGMPPYY